MTNDIKPLTKAQWEALEIIDSRQDDPVCVCGEGDGAFTNSPKIDMPTMNSLLPLGLIEAYNPTWDRWKIRLSDKGRQLLASQQEAGK